MLEKYKSNTANFTPVKRTDLKISDREMDVLNLVAEGKTNMEIAELLFTSVRTIETRRKNLLDKTGTTNTATLIKYAVLHGLVR
jgi:DNA-binding NarL/FixJ family response regulator